MSADALHWYHTKRTFCINQATIAYSNLHTVSAFLRHGRHPVWQRTGKLIFSLEEAILFLTLSLHIDWVNHLAQMIYTVDGHENKTLSMQQQSISRQSGNVSCGSMEQLHTNGDILSLKRKICYGRCWNVAFNVVVNHVRGCFRIHPFQHYSNSPFGLLIK